MFSEADLGDSQDLRIVGIDGILTAYVTNSIPIEPNCHAMGYRVRDASLLFQKGILTRDQFILEVLTIVSEDSPKDESEIFEESLEQAKRAAVIDTRQRINNLISKHRGIISPNTGPVALTAETRYGNCERMVNLIAFPPSIVSAEGKIFYAYKKPGGEAALVSFNKSGIEVVYEDGTVSVYPNDLNLSKATGLVPAEEAAEIIQNLHSLLLENP